VVWGDSDLLWIRISGWFSFIIHCTSKPKKENLSGGEVFSERIRFLRFAGSIAARIRKTSE
jgi:hypothetical protein